MGGMMMLGTAMVGSSIISGMAQSDAAKAEAEQVGLEAKSQELQRREELQDALAMQAAIAGAGGRVGGVGSLQAIQQADVSKAGKDIGMIQAGAKANQAAIKAGGRAQRFSTITSGLTSAGMMAMSASKVKAPTTQVK